MNETVEDMRRRRTSRILTVAPGARYCRGDCPECRKQVALSWVGYEAYLQRTRSIPEKSNSSSRRVRLLTRSLRMDLSKEMICETFATESFGNPVTRVDKLTLPGASAHFKLLVSGTQMAVETRL